MSQAKPFVISKREVWEAYQQVKANQGAAGVDGQTLEQFAQNENNHLYKLWNRMSSGSYRPQPVRRVDIPKMGGKTRPLGIPTVADRIAQTVVKRALEPTFEAIFDRDSFGYRPGRSAHQALAVARRRCWERDWVLDLDIRGFFDTIDHRLLMHAVRKHTQCAWVLLYIERWLAMPVQMPDGNQVASMGRGTPQGAVISPLLANLFLHYVFDRWMRESHTAITFERYADDIVCHCRSEQEAKALRQSIEDRLARCKLALHPEKTKVVYCKDANRKGLYISCSFDFLGYEFRPREARNRRGQFFTNFTPAISAKAARAIRRTVRRWAVHRRSDLGFQQIVDWLSPVLRGWVQYYGYFHRSALNKAMFTIDRYLVRWALRKYKRLKRHWSRGWQWLNGIKQRQPNLLPHWIFGEGG